MSTIGNNLDVICGEIGKTALACGRNPEDVTLIAVTKKKPEAAIQEAIACGVGHIGENYIQEATAKIEAIGRSAACWHFIGHLQSNKARFAVRYFDYIHTVDSIKLAREIDQQAGSIHKIQAILIQVNIGDETTKFGTDADQAMDLVKRIHTFENISIQGLMCMPPFFDDPESARPYFKKLVRIRDLIQKTALPNVCMTHLSMGMSNDFKVAIEEGATMVRIGTSIFGARQ